MSMLDQLSIWGEGDWLQPPIMALRPFDTILFHTFFRNFSRRFFALCVFGSVSVSVSSGTLYSLYKHSKHCPPTAKRPALPLAEGQRRPSPRPISVLRASNVAANRGRANIWKQFV